MVPERSATGRVAAVYSDIRTRLPFVPSFFKSLALNPIYLELAWLQVRELSAVLDAEAEALRSEGADLADEAGAPELPVRPAAVLEPFRPVVPRMALTVELLDALLSGEIPEIVRPDLRLAEVSGPVREPAMAVIEPAVAAPAERRIYVDIQSAYGVPFVASLFRALSAAGELEAAWQVAAPFQRSPAGRRLAGRLRDAARTRIRVAVPAGFAGSGALAAAGQSDAAAGLTELLALYRLAVPQAFAFAVLVP